MSDTPRLPEPTPEIVRKIMKNREISMALFGGEVSEIADYINDLSLRLSELLKPRYDTPTPMTDEADDVTMRLTNRHERLKTLCKTLERHLAAPAMSAEEDAKRYRWLRETASIRFDCGGWVIGFENWLVAPINYPRPINDEPIDCGPGIVDAAIDAARKKEQ